jgi:hypothetical protein
MYTSRGQQNRLKAVFFLLALFALTVTSFGSKRTTLAFTDVQIQQAIIQALGKPFFIDDSDRKIHYVARATDLNNDQKDEVLVWAACCGYGGTGGYHLLIFTNDNAQLKLLTKIAHVWMPLIIQKTKHHGWHDIVFQQGGGGAELEYVVSQYTGKGYTDDKLPNVMRKQIKGKWLVGKQNVMTIIGPRPLLK